MDNEQHKIILCNRIYRNESKARRGFGGSTLFKYLFTL